MISFGVITHRFIPQDIRIFWLFDFEYRENTDQTFTLNFVTYSCTINRLSIFWEKCSGLRQTCNWLPFDWFVNEEIVSDVSDYWRRVIEITFDLHAVMTLLNLEYFSAWNNFANINNSTRCSTRLITPIRTSVCQSGKHLETYDGKFEFYVDQSKICFTFSVFFQFDIIMYFFCYLQC